MVSEEGVGEMVRQPLRLIAVLGVSFGMEPPLSRIIDEFMKLYFSSDEFLCC